VRRVLMPSYKDDFVYGQRMGIELGNCAGGPPPPPVPGGWVVTYFLSAV
jgi:hypothetical protein